MKCQFCAEEIKGEATLCRFCGASKVEGIWKAPSITRGTSSQQKTPGKKGAFTIKSSAGLFLLSAVFELFSITSAIPLFGSMRAGFIAILYHGLYVGLFTAVGLGMWWGSKWTVRLVLSLTAIYTADKIRYVLDTEGRAAELEHMLGGYDGVTELFGEGLFEQALTSTTWIIVLAWWGFALYIYWRRHYFEDAT